MSVCQHRWVADSSDTFFGKLLHYYHEDNFTYQCFQASFQTESTRDRIHSLTDENQHRRMLKVMAIDGWLVDDTNDAKCI